MAELLKKSKLSDLYYIIVLLIYTLSVYVSAVRPGVLAAGLMVLVGILCIYSAYKKYKSDSKNVLKTFGSIYSDMSLMDKVVLIYFVYNILSVFVVLNNGFPIGVFFGEFITSILPIVFYFAAIYVNGNNKSNENYKENSSLNFHLMFLIAVCYAGIIGIILNALAPQVYLDYLFDLGHISLADAPTARVRMNSLVGSTSLGYVAVASMLSAAYVFFKTKFKVLGFTSFAFSFVIAFLSNQRSAMVAAILVILYINFLVFFVFKVFDKKFAYIEIGTVIVLVVVLLIVFPGVFEKIMPRILSLPGAVGERSESWIAALNNMKGQWFGNGLGCNGHRINGMEGTFLVADGGLVKIFCEEGAIGFGLFVFVIIEAFKKGIKNLSNSFADIFIVFTALIMSIGSNIISFQLCAPVFFYALGAISKEDK